MLVQESFLEHESMHDEPTDESDETLSLCDLPLYGDRSVEDDWEDDLCAGSQGSTSISSSSSDHHHHHDYFEFFSHELTTCFPPENIIFCGKIIPYRKPDAPDTAPSKGVECQQPTSIEKKRSWQVFRWRISSKTGNKMPVLTSSSSGKARWYLLLTGISRFSSGMELKDIKSRQTRRHIHSPPQSPTSRVQNQDEKVAGSTGSSRLWEVIRVLSCGGNHHPNAMVVGSIRCNRLE